MIQAFAPGKLILSGEHSVVYGHQAIAMAVNKGITVTLQETEGPSHCAQADARLQHALKSILPTEGVSLSFTSQLPIGRGMGSSAALSIAIQRALAIWNNESLSFQEEFERGMILERFFHGNPSGVDHSVSALGSGIIYKKGKEKPKITAIDIPSFQLVIIDSGSAGNTAELVNKVAFTYSNPTVSDSISKLGELTSQIAKELQKTPVDLSLLGQLFLQNHQLLQKIGVSTPILDMLVTESMNAGALGAKLSGAGGGGVVFALTESPTPLLKHINQLGYSAFVIQPHQRIS